MTISYPVDVLNTEWATLVLSTGEIINRRRPWPVADGSEIQGQDPDFVMLLHVDDTQPEADTRIYTMEGTETPDADANTLTISWQAVARPIEERIEAADNAENTEMARQVPIEREALATRLMVGALLSYALDNQAFTGKQRNRANKYIAKTQKLWRNRDRRNEVVAQFENGEDADLDTGWEPVNGE